MMVIFWRLIFSEFLLLFEFVSFSEIIVTIFVRLQIFKAVA